MPSGAPAMLAAAGEALHPRGAYCLLRTLPRWPPLSVKGTMYVVCAVCTCSLTLPGQHARVLSFGAWAGWVWKTTDSGTYWAENGALFRSDDGGTAI